jgi:transposase
MVILKPKIGFKAIAVVGAIDLKGKVRTICTYDYSINVEKFIQFLQELRIMKDASIKIYIFLDNLRVHYSLKVREYCRENMIELVFNAAYSSEYNPIERLWALSKRTF